MILSEIIFAYSSAAIIYLAKIFGIRNHDVSYQPASHRAPVGEKV